MTPYRILSLLLAVGFAAVGFIFLFIPDGVIALFNRLSQPLQWPVSPPVGFHFYLVLAAGYMYLVAVMAWLMFRHPENSVFGILLANGKIATSLLSLGFFLLHAPLLIYLANSIVDAAIGTGVLIMSRKIHSGRR
jgi:hypothetical protein